VKIFINLLLLTMALSIAHAESISQIKTKMGVLSLSKKSLKEEYIWNIKLDNKVIAELNNEIYPPSSPSFMTALGNGPSSYNLPKGIIDKVSLVDSENELMVAIDMPTGGNACDGAFVSVFYIKKNGSFKLVNVPGDECTVVNKITVQENKMILYVAGIKKPLVYEDGGLKTLAVSAPPEAPVYKNEGAAKKAFECLKLDRENCPYFTEVYNNDSDFRNSLQDSLKKSGFAIFEGNLEDPMTPITIGGESFIYGNVLNKYTDEKIEVLYSLQRKISVGLYYQEYDKGNFFGNPSTKEQQVLKDINSGKAASEGPYPIVVN